MDLESVDVETNNQSLVGFPRNGFKKPWSLYVILRAIELIFLALYTLQHILREANALSKVANLSQLNATYALSFLPVHIRFLVILNLHQLPYFTSRTVCFALY